MASTTTPDDYGYGDGSVFPAQRSAVTAGPAGTGVDSTPEAQAEAMRATAEYERQHGGASGTAHDNNPVDIGAPNTPSGEA